MRYVDLKSKGKPKDVNHYENRAPPEPGNYAAPTEQEARAAAAQAATARASPPEPPPPAHTEPPEEMADGMADGTADGSTTPPQQPDAEMPAAEPEHTTPTSPTEHERQDRSLRIMRSILPGNPPPQPHHHVPPTSEPSSSQASRATTVGRKRTENEVIDAVNANRALDGLPPLKQTRLMEHPADQLMLEDDDEVFVFDDAPEEC